MNIRIEAHSEAEARQAASRMGVVIRTVYRKRSGNGVMAYGYLPNTPVQARTNVSRQVAYQPVIKDDCPF